jgi:hypothetical protein
MFTATTTLRDDLLTGAAEIAEFIGWPERKIYHAAAQGYLPIGKTGHFLIARKSELSAALRPAPALRSVGRRPARHRV